jgi:hypothetical protein
MLGKDCYRVRSDNVGYALSGGRGNCPLKVMAMHADFTDGPGTVGVL